MTSSIIELASVAIGSGVLTQVISAFVTRKQQTSVDFTEIIKTWQEDNHRLRELEEESRRRIIELEHLVHDLHNKIILLESATQDLPIPMWLKDLDGKMLALNVAYEQLFLTPKGLSRTDYIGKYDSDIWPKELAERFTKLDRTVSSTNRIVKSNETVPLASGDKDYLFIKFPRYAGRVMVGVGGMAIDKDLNNI